MGKLFAAGPVGPISQVEFLGSGSVADCHAWVVSLLIQVVEFIHRGVVHRRAYNVRA